jgi:hypothetical protein
MLHFANTTSAGSQTAWRGLLRKASPFDPLKTQITSAALFYFNPRILRSSLLQPRHAAQKIPS